jgi:fermentation-respiration switch protein FrsA (DUF1100 family)
MTRLRQWLIVALVVYAILCALAGIFVAEATLHPQRRWLYENALAAAERVAQGAGSNLQTAGIQTQDRVALKAWLIQPAAANGNAVILLHGLGDNRLGMIGYAELLLSRGYTVLMPDARAHGQSDGTIATYGLLERRDIRQWALWLRSDLNPKCIFGLGESMGAAQLLQSLEKDSPFCAVAAESSFSNFREIGYDRVGQFFHTGPWLGRTLLRPIIEVAFLYSRWRYGVDLQQASPEASVAMTNVPVLLIHGQIDNNIPLRHSERIKAAAPSVLLWEVPRADHCGAISIAPEEFSHRLLDWFSIHSSAQPMMHVTEN